MPEARNRVLPFAYLAAAAAIVAVALPTSLRPPPEDSTQSAALSPDAPPDEEPEQIIQSLQQAASRTAGATGGDPGPGEPTTTTAPPPPPPPPEERASRGQCFGDPPRASHSYYAAPCAPAFVGDNGGETHKNVFSDVVYVGVSHTIGNGTEGPVPDTPRENEGGADRTLRVLQAYFNENYETYGRKFNIVQLPASTADPVESQAHAVKADEEYRLFAAKYLYSGFCEEFASRDLVSFCNPMPIEFHQRWEGNLWAFMMDYTAVDRMGAEYICKKLAGKNADFAGGAEEGQPRKFGLLYEKAEARNASRDHEFIAAQLEARCGLTDVESISIDTTTGQVGAMWAQALAQFRAAGVTSIVLQIEFVPAVQLMSAADSSGYFPEWLLFFPYGLDFNAIGSLLPQAQMAHAFGLSAWEQPAPNIQNDCFKAYKSIDPEGTPNQQTCSVFYRDLEQMANGIQEAGPDLTPETFAAGLYRIGYRFYPEAWAIGGGYAPGDPTYMDNMGEIWWDPEARKPEDGTPGAYRWVKNGQRYREGELVPDELLVFQDGTAARAG